MEKTSKMLYSKKETADTLGVSLRTVDNLIGRKELVVRRLGRRVLVPITELQKFTRRDHSTKKLSDSFPAQTALDGDLAQGDD